MMNDRARGALLGLAVGDALGTTYEFEAIAQPPYPELARAPATEITGGGPFGLVAGQVTDDTQLAVCLARSLAAHGRLAIDDVAARYVAWFDEAFDVGAQTRAAIDRLADGEPAATAGRSVWRASERRPAGNGSLMRTAPLAVAYADRPDAIVAAAIAESMITHADPRCALACAAFDVAIAAALRGADGGAALLAAARDGLAAGAAQLDAAWADDPIDREHAARAAEDLAADLAFAAAPDPEVYGALHVHRTAGFVRVAFRLAFWHAAHTATWRDAVVDVASRGGDADTNAAIVGALLGARDGARAIPARWIEHVLATAQPGSAAWADAHHPRHLLALVAA